MAVPDGLVHQCPTSDSPAHVRLSNFGQIPQAEGNRSTKLSTATSFVVGFVAATAVMSAMARSSDFPVSWSCADGSRVSIAAGTGGMTITPKGGLLVRLPYAGAMSRHHGWGKYTECYAEDAPCAEGGMSDDRRHLPIHHANRIAGRRGVRRSLIGAEPPPPTASKAPSAVPFSFRVQPKVNSGISNALIELDKTVDIEP